MTKHIYFKQFGSIGPIDWTFPGLLSIPPNSCSGSLALLQKCSQPILQSYLTRSLHIRGRRRLGFMPF